MTLPRHIVNPGDALERTGRLGPATPGSTPARSPGLIAPDVLQDLLERLSAPFSPDEYRETPLAENDGHDAAIVERSLPVARVWDRLDEVLTPAGYTESYDVISTSPFAVACHLTVGGLTRTGMWEGDTIDEAQAGALLRAAVRFGLGRDIYDSRRTFVRFRRSVTEREE